MTTDTTNTCPRPRCTGTMTAGKALAPMFGNFRRTNGKGITLYATGASMTTVNKCCACGHSITAARN